MYETRGFKSRNPYVTAPKTLDPAKVVVEKALGATVPDTMRLPPRTTEPVPPPPAKPEPLRLVQPGDLVRAEDINQMIRFMNMFTIDTNIPGVAKASIGDTTIVSMPTNVAKSQLGGIISGAMNTTPVVQRSRRIITKKRQAR